MKDVLPFTGISPSWYRDFTTNPIWKEIESCQQDALILRHCKGFLPLQWTTNISFCDKISYQCVDRSDEGDCEDTREHKISAVRFSLSKTSLLLSD